MPIEIQGVRELSARLLAMTEGLDAPEAYRVFLVAARKIRDRAKSNVPVGKTRNLRKAIVAKQARKRKDLGPAAYSLVNLFKGATKAPHGHLVEFGTKLRRPKRGKFLAFKDERNFGLKGWKSGDMVFVRQVRPMRPNPFFRTAIETAGPAALQAAAAETQRLIEKAK